ncbi:hypothetical protein [Ruegeria atlantica]|uniref:hypothetical protein n=1 Tax=Ruegeria atlantica TaxID=81569 RepID=UPI00249572AF|nr:hypothetical protein [Ruegeria atlantica]
MVDRFAAEACGKMLTNPSQQRNVRIVAWQKTIASLRWYLVSTQGFTTAIIELTPVVSLLRI